MTAHQSIKRLTLAALVAASFGIASLAAQQSKPQERQEQAESGGFRFKTRTELINVTATVFDRNERFVSGLRREDFTIYEDDASQPITHFSDERVPVSLGLVLDVSGSMEGDKWHDARERDRALPRPARLGG